MQNNTVCIFTRQTIYEKVIVWSFDVKLLRFPITVCLIKRPTRATRATSIQIYSISHLSIPWLQVQLN